MLNKEEITGIIDLLANIQAELEDEGLIETSENLQAIIEKLKKHI